MYPSSTESSKIVFIDIDGTLVADDGGVPESAARACREARANGHLLYLCTGRSKPEIYDSIWEIGFDGLIGAGGGYVECGSDILYHKQVSPEDVVHLVDFFEKNGIDFYLESNAGLYASRNLRERLIGLIYGDVDNDPAARERLEHAPHPFLEALTYGESNLYKSDVNKVCFLESDMPFESIRAEFAGKFEAIPCTVPMFGRGSGELTVPGVHKAVAIADLLVHLGRSVCDTVAIGDGLNDLEMLRYCAVGIAMGDARDELKAEADHVTGTLEEDGLHDAFVKYGLISGNRPPDVFERCAEREVRA
ncbi:Cof-type HAD-IIB family hydrolase [Saccharibacillus alkalitolerans]|uniref:Cof-type HAD-IIB family hydrolase n=1 Tax=Saccharibacillus alkalitolerans TaxID=2705290 RepID=A0ABX0F9A3_9BACL|nr:Cof-type HAD-IIB family hydrolase [Saccharibacillus alkalitolerans]NGZ74577.1 Cof-type HAD-IIB family hydrolase [Saccharibacillus alkalitolerans]